jgi:16S rRNA (uracil1498-N3)-methyltransferase
MKLLYLPLTLSPGSTVPLPEDIQHRLYRVMRMGQGESISLFNGMCTAAVAEIADSKCRTALITALLPEKPPLPTRVLALGIPKREAWESALRQATEMGATSIIPLKTRFAQVGKLNTERDHRHLVEAAEQSERYTLPTLLPLTSLGDFLASLTNPCLWAYERLTGPLPTHPETAPHSVLVGPEGGFAPEEVTLLQNHKFIRPFTLGPTILRTDTAVVAALTRLSLTA